LVSDSKILLAFNVLGAKNHEKTTNDNFEIDVQALFQLQSWSRFDLKFHVEIVFKPCN
jgi:hypothetical protein